MYPMLTSRALFCLLGGILLAQPLLDTLDDGVQRHNEVGAVVHQLAHIAVSLRVRQPLPCQRIASSGSVKGSPCLPAVPGMINPEIVVLLAYASQRHLLPFGPRLERLALILHRGYARGGAKQAHIVDPGRINSLAACGMRRVVVGHGFISEP